MPSSLRLIEEALSYRSLDISYETIRRWSNKFSCIIASQLRKRRSKPKGKWHIDEVYVKIKGQKYWLWRAVDE
jgi:putative transposase